MKLLNLDECKLVAGGAGSDTCKCKVVWNSTNDTIEYIREAEFVIPEYVCMNFCCDIVYGRGGERSISYNAYSFGGGMWEKCPKWKETVKRTGNDGL